MTAVKYWTAAGSLRAEPNGSIAVGTLGRMVEYFGYVIYPPAAGWPLVLDNSLIEIGVTRGQDTPEALRAAVILCVRQFYDGYRLDSPDRGVLRDGEAISRLSRRVDTMTMHTKRPKMQNLRPS